MSLQVWLPLTRDLRNQGLSNITVTNNGATFSSSGKLGGCYSFDGTNDKIQISNLPNPKNISVAFWMKRNADTGTRQFMFTAWNGITCELTASNSFHCGVYNNGSTVAACTNTTEKVTVSSGWVHVVYTFEDKIGGKLYLNGSLIYTSSFNGSIQWSTTTGNIGYYSTYFNGLINDFRIYDHCLSSTEVKQIAQGLVLHYPLNNNGYGNENLLPYSGIFSSTTGWTSNQDTTLSTSNNELKVVLNQSTSTPGIKTTNTINLSAGTYTISMLIKVENGNKDYINYVGYLNNGSVIYSGAYTKKENRGDYVYEEAIFTIAEDASNIVFYALTSSPLTGETWYIKNIKLEKGDKATQWCPNSSNVSSEENIEYDISGYCNNGTRTGNFSWTDDTPKYQVSTTINSSKIQCITNPITGDDPIFSIGFWFKLKSNISYIIYADLVSFSSSSYSNQPFRLEICGNPVGNDIYWFRGPTGNTGGFKINTSSLVRDIWYHTTLVSEGNKQYSYYINGIKIGSYNGSANSWIPTNIFSIGDGQEGAFNISDVRIYATALSAEDILELYQQKGYANSFEGNNLIYYEYIQNNDLTQYIDLQTSLINKTVEVKFQQTPLVNRLNTVYGGEDNGDPWYAYGFRFNSSTAYMYLNGNLDTTGVNNGITTPAPDENIHIFRGIHKINQKSSATLDGEALPVVETIPNKFSTRTALLFATKGLGNPGGLKNNNLDLRVYYFKIWDENDNLTHYLRPCSYNGHTGMWNEVDNTFYPNCGKGEFTCGNIIGD